MESQRTGSFGGKAYNATRQVQVMARGHGSCSETLGTRPGQCRKELT